MAKKKNDIIRSSSVEYLTFIASTGEGGINAIYEDENIWLTQKMMGQSEYNMAYFHIRDFDSKQKHVYSLRYFQSYYGIQNAYSKLEKYLKEFPFISLGEAIRNTDWNKVSRVDLWT